MIDFKFIDKNNIYSIIPLLQILDNSIFDEDKLIGISGFWLLTKYYVGNKRAQKFWEKEGYEVIALHFQKKY